MARKTGQKTSQGNFVYRRSGYFELTGDVDPSGEVAKERFSDIIGLKKILLSDHKKIAYNFVKNSSSTLTATNLV